MRLHKLFLAAGILVICAALSPNALADITYTITVDTSSQATSMGYIEFQFNGSSFGSQLADAAIENFATDGALIPPGMITNDSSGQLPGTVTMDNATSFDDYIEEMTFGTNVTFDLLLSGPAITNPNGLGGGAFILDFLNADQSAYLFTDNATTGAALEVDINPDGSTTATPYSTDVTANVKAAVPEPAFLPLMGSGLLFIAVLARRSRRFT